MTKDDEAREIGRMYVEREEVQRRLSCLDNKSRRLEKLLRDAADALEEHREGEDASAPDSDLPTRDDILALMKDQSSAHERLRKLNAFFEARQ